MDESFQTRWPTLAVVLGALVLTGCSHLRLHSPALDADGQKALKAWNDVDLRGIVQAERDRTNIVLAQEVAYYESANLLARDMKLLQVATGSIDKRLKEPVDAGYKEYAGDATFYLELQAAKNAESEFRTKYEVAAQALALRGLEMPGCADLLNGKAAEAAKDWPDPKGTTEALDAGKAACTPAPDGKSDPNAVRKLLKCSKATGAAFEQCTAGMPLVQKDFETYYSLQATRATQKSAHVTDRNEYLVAASEYKRLKASPEGKEPAPPAKAASAPDSSASAAKGLTRTKLDAAFERLKTAVTKLKGLEDKFSLKLATEERLSAIEEALGSLLSPKAAGAEGETDKDRAGRALQRLADTADGWQTAKDSAAEVLRQPLLAQQEVERLQAEALRRSIEVDDAALSLQRYRADIAEKLARHYKAAKDSLTTMGTVSVPPDELMTIDRQGAPPSAELRVKRMAFMRAASNYGYAVGYLQGQYEAVDVRQQYLRTAMRDLDVAEYNLRQWDPLISANVDLLAKWASGGVREETISRGINSLLLLWIGLGVH